MVPSMSEEMARHLAQDGNASFRKYARDAGMQAVSVAFIQVLIAPSTVSLPAFERDEGRLASALEKLVESLGLDFGLTAVRNRQLAYLRYPTKDRLQIIRLIKEQRVLILEDKRGPEDKASSCLDLIERCRPYKDAIDLANLYAFYIPLLRPLNQEDRAPHFYDLAIEAALQNGDLELASQLLGTLGVIFARQNDTPRMHATWNRGLELAREGKSWQEARILEFYSSYYLNEGRFALSRELMRRAQDRCRELSQSRTEIRFLVDGVLLVANMGYWPAIGQQLQRADVLLREGEKFWSAKERDDWDFQVKRCRALYFSGVGRFDDSERLARQIIERTSSSPPSGTQVVIQLEAIRILRKCGVLGDALHLLEERSAFAHQYGELQTQALWDMETAELRFALGDYQGCRASLRAQAEARRALQQETNLESLRANVVEIRLALVDGNRAVARKRVLESLKSLKTVREYLDLSPEAALALPVACDLGDLAHEILDTNPETGYVREMTWRIENARASHSINVAEAERARMPSPEAMLKRLRDQSAAHCVYRVEADRVLRWTAYEGRIVRDELPLSLHDLERRVQVVRSRVQEGGAGQDTLIHLGNDLARAILPANLLAAPPRRIFITPDGPLTQLPFDALSISPTSYVPLLQRSDMAYLLFDRPVDTASPGRALIVSEPDYSPELKQRYSILTEMLPLGDGEANAFAHMFPKSMMLQGAQATKVRVVGSWSKADALYFACHTIQDPDLPYLAFLPLSSSGTDREEDELLDIVDVRNADLSHCGLVVLSSCGSGSSWVVGRLSMPSLAQSFLEAGAQAVISTAWNVKDEDAARIMHAFTTGYNPAGRDPVRALSQARRQFLEAGAPPQTWASYSVMLGSL